MGEIATRDFMQYGAVGGGIVDDRAAIMSALTARTPPYPFTGSGRTFAVSDDIICPPGAYIEDAHFVNIDTNKATARTLFKQDVGGTFTLVNVSVDRNALSTEGTFNDAAGIWVNESTEVSFTNVKVTGDGAGKGIVILGYDYHTTPSTTTKVRLTGCNVHDMFFTDTISPAGEILQGIYINYGYDVLIRDTIIDHLYLSIGGGPQRNFQSDGLALGACDTVVVENCIIKRVMEGIDIASSDPSRNITIINLTTEDCDAYGIKVFHDARDVSIIGCKDYRAGIAGFLVGPASVANVKGAKNILHANCMARDTGYQSNWGPGVIKAGFKVTPANPPLAPFGPTSIMYTGCSAIDTQAVPTMEYGYAFDNLVSSGTLVGEIKVVGHTVVGATVADFLHASVDANGNMVSS